MLEMAHQKEKKEEGMEELPPPIPENMGQIRVEISLRLDPRQRLRGCKEVVIIILP
jgi:hypothetical protein